MMRVAAFSGGELIPSARFRVRQYIPALRQRGIELVEMPARAGKYPPSSHFARPLWLLAALHEQMGNLRSLGQYDLVLLQREVISKLVTIERWIRKPVVLDVDDAIFLFRQGYVARRLAQLADVVICGNTYLAAHFSAWNSRVVVIPTPVDTEKYHPSAHRNRSGRPVIGWIGTSSNLIELQAIAPMLSAVLERVPEARLRVISDRRPDLPAVNPDQIEYVRWNESTEIADIQSLDIGIMPLRDSPWARGKCSFKMLQYMACGLPSVVSAVGMNAEVARLDRCAIGVSRGAEWVDGLLALLEDEDLRSRMGNRARRVVEQRFSVSALAPQFADVIHGVL